MYYDALQNKYLYENAFFEQAFLNFYRWFSEHLLSLDLVAYTNIYNALYLACLHKISFHLKLL